MIRGSAVPGPAWPAETNCLTLQNPVIWMDHMSNDLKLELKQLIVDTLNLEDVDPLEIGDDEPIFGSSLDLDSIDGLELVLQLEKSYGIKIGSSEASKSALHSINVLAEFIEKERTPPS